MDPFLIAAIIALILFAAVLYDRKALYDRMLWYRERHGHSDAFGYGSPVWPGLAKVVEEGGEVQQVLGKLIMVAGDHERHWDGNLIAKLEEEIPDLQAALAMFCGLNEDKLDRAKMEARFRVKMATFRAWQTAGLAERNVL